MIFTYLRMNLITAAFGIFLFNHDCRGKEHLGCYADNRTDRLLPTLAKVSNSNTVDLCIDTCKKIGKTYAGVEYGQECWCGNSQGFPRRGVTVATDNTTQMCYTQCKGNASQVCGGLSYINIYSVCPRGRYHDPEGVDGNCDSECYCNASHICLYSTGQCPDGCQDGWYWASCSFTNANGPSTIDYTDTSHITTDVNGASTMEYRDTSHITTGIAVGVAIVVLVILVFTAVVGFCCYRRRQKNLSHNANESRNAKAASRLKRQEEDGDVHDKEGVTVVENDLYGVSNNNYPIEKEDSFGCVNLASKPPGWNTKKGDAVPAESYTMATARCAFDARQKQPVQSDVVIVDNALYEGSDGEDDEEGNLHGNVDG